MSTTVLIIGPSGTGKSTAVRSLPAPETFIINVLDKPLPFKGANKKYVTASAENPSGNSYASDSSTTIIALLDKIDKNRPDIKYLVIDDFGYIMTKDFMSRALVKGYDKFNEIALSTWNLMNRVKKMRANLMCFITMHSEIKEDGVSKPKTIGKMTDEKVCLEGMVTYVFHSVFADGKYKFTTNHNGALMAKTPIDMFADRFIDNDLKLIADTIQRYNDEDIPI